MKLTKPFKGMTAADISQTYHDTHPALDICKTSSVASYGTPLCAPEDCEVVKITGDKYTPNETHDLERGYGIYLKGLESGYSYLFWHILPVLPVNVGDTVKRGSVVAFMGNAGLVYTNGVYVPLEKRTSNPFAGSHLHLEMFDKGYKPGKKKNFLNPLYHLDITLEPTYSYIELLSATAVVLKKTLKLIKKI